MKKVLVWILLVLMAVTPILGMSACNDEPEPIDPDQPGDTTDPDGEVDPSSLPTVPSEREVTVSQGTAIHENTDELGRIPEGLAEAVNKYMSSYEAMNLQGPKTTFQTQNYTELQYLSSDAVMAYYAPRSGSIEAMEKWAELDERYELHMMTIINRTDDEGYLEEHADQIMLDSTGTRLANGSEYYIMPCDEWTEYVWAFLEEALEVEAIQTVVFEEPDLFKESGYSDVFKREWQKYYGEPWVDQTTSPDAMVKSQKLKIYLLNRMMETLVARVREKRPDVKVYIAVHSTPSYNVTKGPGQSGIPGLVSGMNYYLNTGLYDGLIGQTWTDTAGATLTQDGVTFNNRYLAGYLGYASYVDGAGDKDLYTLADPVGDGIKTDRTEDYYIPHYFNTVVAQLMQPTINRFQITVWPFRSFEAASQEYKAVQLSVMKAQNEVAGKAAVQSAGTPGISYVLSDSLTYQNNANATWAPSSNDSFLGMTLPLLTDGIPLSITSMEQIRSVEDLEGINLLLLSFDGQKPMDASVCEIIADWIEQGGVCLYVGGHDAYDQIADAWWGSNSTPFQALLDMLNLDVTVESMTLDADTRLEWVGDGKQTAINAFVCPDSYNSFYTCFEGDCTPVLALDGKTVGIDEQVGKGRMVAFSIPAALFTTQTGGSAVMRKLTEYACQYAEYKYDSTTLMWTKRGNVVAAYSFDQKNVLTGRYIDLFDPQLGYYTHYVMEADESALLYDVTDIVITDTPQILFSGGELTVTEQSASVTKFNVVSPESATVATRIAAPDGLYPQRISAENYKGNIQVECLCAWDSKTDSLLIHFQGLNRGVNVTVEWGATPVDDYELQQPAALKDFAPIIEQQDLDRMVKSGKAILSATTNKNGNPLDKKFILNMDNVQVGTYNYYCDGDNEVIWGIDLNVYTNAYVALALTQNYKLEVSTDRKNWTEIQNFITVNGHRIDSNTNTYIIGVDSRIYAKDADMMYIRLSNADPDPKKGWGGAVNEYHVLYDAPVIPETDPKDYAPLVNSLDAYDKAYASLNKYSVASNSEGKDAEFIYVDYAQATAALRYCDVDHEIILKFDLTKYEDALIALQISQNYRIQVSTDDLSYVTVQDWLLAGNEWSSVTNNKTYLILDSSIYAPESSVLYVRIDNAGTDKQGWGGALYGITVYYGGEPAHVEQPDEPDTPDAPTLPEITPEDYAPLTYDLGEYDLLYASRNKLSVLTNQNGDDRNFLDVGATTGVATASCRYCDGYRELVYQFDLTKYENAVIALEVCQNYRVCISLDGQNYVTVRDWILAGNEWGTILKENMAYVIIDSALYAQGTSTLYVKIDNAGTDQQGYGGAIYSITLYYEGEAIVEEPSALDKEIATYLDVLTDDVQTRAELSAAYAMSTTVPVNSQNPGADAAFLVSDTVGINKNCKFCDGARSLVYKYDLTQYKDAVVMLKIANNYNVRVSSDGESWTTVQDYVNVHGSRIASSDNVCWLVIDSADFVTDASTLYVRMGNSGDKGGYGGAVYEFTVFYNE